MMNNKISVLGTVLSMLVSISWAQSDTLSLEGAISRALKNNYQIQVAQLDQEIAKNNNTWGNAGRLPNLNFTAGSNNSDIYRKPTNPFALAGWNQSDNINGQMDVSWVLFNGFKTSINKNTFSRLEELSKGNAAVVVENTIQSVITSFYLALAEKKKTELLKNVLSLSIDRLELVKSRKQLGVSGTFEVLQEQTTYLADSTRLITQQINYRNAIRSLNTIMAAPIDAQYTLIGELPAPTKEYNFEDLVSAMQSNNQNLNNQMVNLIILKNNVKIAESNIYPTITLNTGGTGSLDWFRANIPDRTTGTITNQLNDGYNYGAYANITLRYNLFSGGQLRRTVSNARIQEEMSQLNKEQLKLNLSNELSRTLDLYTTRKGLLGIHELSLSAAELNLKLAQERFKQGAISSFDMRTVQLNYLNVVINKYDTLIQALDADTGILRLTGSILRQYVD